MPNIQQHPIGQCGYWGQLYKPLWLVVHFTGGTPNLPSLYNYWVSQCNIGPNSHFGIERVHTSQSAPGDIWQFLPLTGGAAANCCLEAGAAPFLPNTNLNVRTISVECINPDTGNNGDMPIQQYDSLVYLIRTVCTEMGIPTDRYTEYYNGYETSHCWGDSSGGIIMHRDIAPQNRRMCPGTPYYSGQMDEIMIEVNYQQTGGASMSNPEYVKQLHPDSINAWLAGRWRAMYALLDQPGPPENTGIFQYWKQQMLAGNDPGPALSYEYQVGWHYVQDFTNCQMSYDNRPTSPQPSRYNILPGSEVL